jgi:hypothetical protein
MSESEYRQVIDKLECVIRDIRDTIARFEDTGMDERMPEDYARLHEIYSKAVREQRAYTLAMLKAE